jgi:adenylate cyclase
VEIERRFLCRAPDPGLLAGADRRHEIVQGYLTRHDPAVRIRRRDARHFLTIKSGAGLVRQEVEVPVEDAGAAATLLAMAGDHVVEKTRHVLGRWELDVYHGALDGLVVAEAELVAPDEPLPPAPAGLVLLREVTHERGFTAQALAFLGPDEARAFVQQALRTVQAG